jgi:hypothetical protein
MLLQHVLIVAIAAATPARSAIKLASPGLVTVRVDPALTTFFSDHLAEQIAALGLSTITQTEIGTLLGLERQRQLLACTESSCAAEVANALGVDAIVLGSIGQFEKTFQINIKVIAARDGRTLSVFTDSVDGEKRVLAALTRGAQKLAADVRRELGSVTDTTATQLTSEPSGARRWWWVPAAGGAVVAAVGGYFLLRANSDSNSLTGGSGIPTATYAQALQLHDDGAQSQTIGLIAVGVGAAAVAASGVLWGFSETGARPTLSRLPGGGSLGIAGVFP